MRKSSTIGSIPLITELTTYHVHFSSIGNMEKHVCQKGIDYHIPRSALSHVVHSSRCIFTGPERGGYLHECWQDGRDQRPGGSRPWHNRTQRMDLRAAHNGTHTAIVMHSRRDLAAMPTYFFRPPTVRKLLYTLHAKASFLCLTLSILQQLSRVLLACYPCTVV